MATTGGLDRDASRLAARFAAVLGRPPADAEGPILAAHVRAARDAWPGIELEPEVFVAALAHKLGGAADPARDAGELRLPDLWLATACAEGNPAAMEAFWRSHRGVIRRALGQSDAMGIDAEDLEQILAERLFVAHGDRRPRILDYDGRAALATWLRVVATRLRVDADRRKADRPADAEPEDALDPGADPELRFYEQNYRDAFAEAFRGALADLQPRQRNLLRWVSRGVSASDLAPLYGVDRATTKRWVASARTELRVLTRRRLAAGLHADEATIDSILRLVDSGLGVSLLRALDSQR